MTFDLRRIAAAAAAALCWAGAAGAQPAAIIGSDAAACAPDARDSAALVDVGGLKDRSGVMRIELYPDNDKEFLGDRHKLVAEGKTFRRVETPLPQTGPVRVCIKLPGPGRYALAVIHQRGATRSFTFTKDGIGFPNNPKLYMSKPAVAAVAMNFGAGVTPVAVTLNYKSGLAMRPIKPPPKQP
ncbi:MAG: DUF2141 domain-containing protein [Polymorphobacter sp.]